MPFLAVSEEQKANAKPLEPAFEALLRTVDLDEELITILRVRNVLDREIFSSLEMNEENFRDTIASACGIDNTNFEHKLEIAKLVKAWRTSSLQAEGKSKVDAVQKAHGEPIQMLSEDWAILMRQFKEKIGRNIHASKLPAQSYYEAFQEKLSEGSLAAETLAQVISASEEENQKKNKPESSRQLGLNLDSTLTIQTRRRYIASMPANFEELRIKYKVMSHMWLLSQMRQPGRHLFADLTDRTFSDILEELLSENMFMLQREVAGMPSVVPRWEHCLEYEFQLRKEAIRLTVEENFSIQAALWHAFEDQQHKLTHWVQLLTIANAQQACSSDEVSKLRKEVADLRKMVSQRSRSPRGKGAGKRSLPAPSQLALPAPPTSKGSGKKGKTGKGKKGSQGEKKRFFCKFYFAGWYHSFQFQIVRPDFVER